MNQAPEHYLIINGERIDVTPETRDAILATVDIVRGLLMETPGAIERGIRFIDAVRDPSILA